MTASHNLSEVKAKRSILVLLPLERDYAALNDFKLGDALDVSIHFLDDELFDYNEPCRDFDICAYTQRAVNYVRENNIHGVIYSHDVASLIAAVVCQETGLVGPSLDSVFLACHKYYSREIASQGISYRAINIHQTVLETPVTFPCYIKAPCLMCSHLQFIVHNESEFQQVMEIMAKELPKWGKMFFDFFKQYIPREIYPLAHEEVVLVEELITDRDQCAVEGWTDRHGNIHIWAFSDINYHKGSEKAQNCYSMPSRVLKKTRDDIVALTTQTVTRLGLKNSFFNVDIWHSNGLEPPQVIEVNGRAASLYYLMHKTCFNSDLYKAMVWLCLGEDTKCYLESPLLKSQEIPEQIHGALFFLVTFGKGKAQEYFDFEHATSMQNDSSIHGLEILVNPESWIGDNGTAGTRLAKFFIFGDSYEHINKEASARRAMLLRQSELSPLREHTPI